MKRSILTTLVVGAVMTVLCTGSALAKEQFFTAANCTEGTPGTDRLGFLGTHGARNVSTSARAHLWCPINVPYDWPTGGDDHFYVSITATDANPADRLQCSVIWHDGSINSNGKFQWEYTGWKTVGNGTASWTGAVELVTNCPQRNLSSSTKAVFEIPETDMAYLVCYMPRKTSDGQYSYVNSYVLTDGFCLL